jgi:hypothetical protein
MPLKWLRRKAEVLVERRRATDEMRQNWEREKEAHAQVERNLLEARLDYLQTQLDRRRSHV